MVKYGWLPAHGWQEILQKGFSECFRVLEPGGILIFKWNETDIKVSEILKLTPYKPIFGHISGKRANTHWICFMKTITKMEKTIKGLVVIDKDDYCAMYEEDAVLRRGNNEWGQPGCTPETSKFLCTLDCRWFPELKFEDEPLEVEITIKTKKINDYGKDIRKDEGNGEACD